MCFRGKNRVMKIFYKGNMISVKRGQSIKTPKDLIDYVNLELGVEFISEPMVVFPLNMSLESDLISATPCVLQVQDGNLDKIYKFNIWF